MIDRLNELDFLKSSGGDWRLQYAYREIYARLKYNYSSDGYWQVQWYIKNFEGNFEMILFEDVLKVISSELQEKLLFHLNLFR